MASTKSYFILFFACSLLVQGTLGEVICERLPQQLCSYAVSSSGKRCVLENGGKNAYECKTSEIHSEKLTGGYIETDQCENACGLDRQSVGMSSDALVSEEFLARLCSPACYDNCPNIVDLYSGVAAGEGLSLPEICERVKDGRGLTPVPSDSDGSAARRAALALMYAAAPAPAY